MLWILYDIFSWCNVILGSCFVTFRTNLSSYRHSLGLGMHINVTSSKYCCGSRGGVEEDWAGWIWAIRLLGRFPLQASSRQSKLLWIRSLNFWCWFFHGDVFLPLMAGNVSLHSVHWLTIDCVKEIVAYQMLFYLFRCY